MFDHYSPLFLRRHSAGDDPLMCFATKNFSPYSEEGNPDGYLDIRLHLWTSANIRTVLDYVIQESGHIPRPTMVPIDETLFRCPVWFVEHFTQSDISEFASTLTNNSISPLCNVFVVREAKVDKMLSTDPKDA